MRRALLAAAVAAAMAAGGCGDDSDEPAAETKPKPAPVKVDLGEQPREITCGDLAGDISRRVTVALADELLAANAAYAKEHNRLQTSQSIYYGMTEICKTRDASFKPADEALRGVESGKWEVDLG